MRYLQGTSKLTLRFGSGKPMLVGYIDSDMARDEDSRKSTSVYLITLSDRVVSWQSRLQKCSVLSTSDSCKELLWMKHFFRELGYKQQKYVLFCDNQSSIHLAKNSTFHSRSKHIDVRYHWIRDTLNNKLLELEKIHTN